MLVLVPACGIPHDPHGSLEQAESRGTLRVGIAAGERSRAERRLVEAFAKRRGLTVAWSEGAGPDLLARLERFELDVVACSLGPDDPWKKRVGLTRPWHGEGGPVVLAAPPGENRLLVALDRFLVAGGGRP